MRRHEKKFVTELQSDLRAFADILSGKGLSRDGGSTLNSVAQGLWPYTSDGVEIMSMSGRLDLTIDTANVRSNPSSLNMDDRLQMSFDYRHRFDAAITQNPLEGLINCSINAEVFALDHQAREFKAAWHFDFHDFEEESQMCHPKFHWQFGGYALQSLSSPITGVLLVDTPRFFSPPLDAILGIDFLLSHFNGAAWTELRTATRNYVEIVRRAQRRLWKQYFREIASQVNRAPSAGPIAESVLFPNLT